MNYHLPRDMSIFVADAEQTKAWKELSDYENGIGASPTDFLIDELDHLKSIEDREVASRAAKKLIYKSKFNRLHTEIYILEKLNEK